METQKQIQRKPAPKKWSAKKVCQHCWYYRFIDECSEADCGQQEYYFTYQEFPDKKNNN